jgi:hypothetical protein
MDNLEKDHLSEVMQIPKHILLHAFLFVCVLSLRDVITATLDLIPIPKTNIYWMWFKTILQISLALGMVFVLAYNGWIDPSVFTNG